MMRHIQLRLDTAIRMANGKRSEQNRIKKVLDFSNIKELRQELESLKHKGYDTIPTEGCKHDGRGNCPGHEEEL